MVKSFRKRINNSLHYTWILCVLALSACGVQKAQKTLLRSEALKGAHVGIAVYNASSRQWVDKFQSDYFFIPASNNKIQTCYLGMKYLKDSLPGWQYAENKDSVFLMPLGDPSFLHPDFTYQPVADLIKHTNKQIVLCLPNKPDQFEMYGKGWSWEDYAEDYQQERNRLNIYGNLVTIEKKKEGIAVWPPYFVKNQLLPNQYTAWSREKLSNQFFAKPQAVKKSKQQVPFITDNEYKLAKELIEDSLHPVLPIAIQKGWHPQTSKTIATIPTDSLLKIMMYRSDNFFAEQVLLMTSQQVLGTMNEEALIDTLLKTELAFLPQKQVWVDGSGLSRYNLTTPENYIALLDKMNQTFPMQRIQSVFDQGGKGTLTGYYNHFPGVMYAKTGTLGNQIALSGFILTNKGTTLLFSILISNHTSPTTSAVRRAVEQYLTELTSKY